jgi:hypothetical protein
VAFQQIVVSEKDPNRIPYAFELVYSAACRFVIIACFLATGKVEPDKILPEKQKSPIKHFSARNQGIVRWDENSAHKR